MQPVREFVVYFSNEETASTATHQVIDRDKVYLSKSKNDFRWRMGKVQHEGNFSTHQGVES